MVAVNSVPIIARLSPISTSSIFVMSPGLLSIAALDTDFLRMV